MTQPNAKGVHHVDEAYAWVEQGSSVMLKAATKHGDPLERVIDTLRRELLDHVIVLGERHLCRLLRRYVDEYYHPSRTHLSLGMDAPTGREVELPDSGEVIELPVVGGRHHRYTRRVA